MINIHHKQLSAIFKKFLLPMVYAILYMCVYIFIYLLIEIYEKVA